MGNRCSGFPTRSDTNRAVQSQKMARGSKFCIYEVEELYKPCSENKGADQLRGYREADLRLCFLICKKPVFSQRGSYVTVDEFLQKRQNSDSLDPIQSAPGSILILVCTGCPDLCV